jgi:hypothetical protein
MVEALFTSFLGSLTGLAAVSLTGQPAIDKILRYLSPGSRLDQMVEFHEALSHVILFCLLCAAVICLTILLERATRGKTASPIAKAWNRITEPPARIRRFVFTGLAILGGLLLIYTGIPLFDESNRGNQPSNSVLQTTPVSPRTGSTSGAAPGTPPVSRSSKSSGAAAPGPGERNAPPNNKAIPPSPSRTVPGPASDAKKGEVMALYLNLGNELMTRDNPDYEKAAEMFERVLAIDPTNKDAARGKIRSEQLLGRSPPETSSDKKEEPGSLNDVTSLALRAAKALHEAGEYDKAIIMFIRILAKDPTNKEALEGKRRAEQSKAEVGVRQW